MTVLYFVVTTLLLAVEPYFTSKIFVLKQSFFDCTIHGQSSYPTLPQKEKTMYKDSDLLVNDQQVTPTNRFLSFTHPLNKKQNGPASNRGRTIHLYQIKYPV